ncbi:RNA-binding domain-containing protein [Succinimonas sp.]|uniref:AlbA family DNA-binding domain-containing protein n=1 Tax=Succinimonas sp. TaxID=1936151 RepID=UPI003863916F
MARNKDCGQLLAIPANIHTLLSGGAIAWERIEFRESWQPEESLKTITAFASDIGNRGGGYIVIGVADDNGRPKFPLKGLSPAEIIVRIGVLPRFPLPSHPIR